VRKRETHPYIAMICTSLDAGAAPTLESIARPGWRRRPVWTLEVSVA
jgi:hypothetical protein